MKIEIERVKDEENNLVFTIKVSEPHEAPFTEEDRAIYTQADEFSKRIQSEFTDTNSKACIDICNAIHYLKDKRFDRIKRNLKSEVYNKYNEFHKRICIEIYNWILDAQPTHLRKWMQECDPEREKYYFDNDRSIESDPLEQPYHYDDDDDDD